MPDQWLVVLEQIQQQSRATTEAVYAVRDELILRFEARCDAIENRLTALEIAVRHNSEALRQHSEILRQHAGFLRQHSELLSLHSEELVGLRADVNRLGEKIDRQDQRERLGALELRVLKLEVETG